MVVKKREIGREEGYLGTAPLGLLVFRMGIPTLAAQAVNLLYNIVDRIYIGHIPNEGSLALAGLGIVFPIVLIIGAFSNLIGIGGSNRSSIAMGKGDYRLAENILENCIILILISGILLCFLCFGLKLPILRMFGAGERVLSFADSYLSVYLLGIFFAMITQGLNPFITNQGYAGISMLIVCVGAVLNIILDLFFIYGLRMGVRGAAAATVISQMLSAVWILRFLNSRRSRIAIRWKHLKVNPKTMIAIISLGISPFVMSLTEALVQVSFNNGMKMYGTDLHVSLMSVMFSINQSIWTMMQGFAQGVQPIIGYNYGAGKYSRVWQAFWIMFVLCMAFTLLFVGSVIIWPAFYISLFSDQKELIGLGIAPLRIYMFGLLFAGCQGACQQTFLGLGEAKTSVFVAVLRKLVLLFPLSLVLPRINGAGVWGLYWAEPICDMISVSVCGVLFYATSKKILAAPS